MKKLLLVLLAMFMFSVIGSYANNDGKILKDIVNTTEMVSDLPDEPVYWQGTAHGTGTWYLYINVYQVENQCNSYVAYVTGGYFGPASSSKVDPPYKAWVRENPDFGKYTYDVQGQKYYITYQNKKYYFNMD